MEILYLFNGRWAELALYTVVYICSLVGVPDFMNKILFPLILSLI